MALWDERPVASDHRQDFGKQTRFCRNTGEAQLGGHHGGESHNSGYSWSSSLWQAGMRKDEWLRTDAFKGAEGMSYLHSIQSY